MVVQRIEYYLNKARPYYAQACTLIRDLSQLAVLKGKHFPYEQSMVRFDNILQTILLNVAVEDGSFSGLDESFIRSLTRYGDAMVVINREAQKTTPNWNMTWKGIQQQRESFGPELAVYAAKIMEAEAEAFAADFAPMDSMVARDYLKDLRQCVLEMMIPMSLVDDGNVTAAHNLKTVALADKLLTEKWGKYLKHTDYKTPAQKTTTQKTTQQNPIQQKTTRQTAVNGNNQVNFSSDHLVNHVDQRERYANAVVFIEVEKAEYCSCGSGVIITRNGFALTCAHVVEGARKLMVKVSNAGCEPVFVPATVHSVDKTNDLAVIKMQEGTYYYAELDLDRQEPVLGENIAIYGYPFGSNMSDSALDLNVSFCRGYVASNQTIGGKRRTLLDITARSGNSGSPVTSLDNGKVIGIYFGGYGANLGKPSDDKICGMTPMRYVRALLK